ncbi:hypothetical protein JCM10908_001074 [Rhodotorula pacifica]|uniref:leucine carboxy methyltransferase n=1 Tax=Rhodotorula pacifica TaxID=1495444 RepID=UPI003171038D
MFPPERTAGEATSTGADAAVRSTDSDALYSRHCAASLGYFSDPFSLHFLSPSQRRSAEKRPPLINIGTHARTWAVDQLVHQFIDANAPVDQVGLSSSKGRCQVLSLGAGTDSRFWRFRKAWHDRAGGGGQGVDWPCAKWVEVDFPEATATKARAISTKPDLKKWLGGEVKIERGGLGLSSPYYTLLPGDIRQLDSLSASLVSPPAPTSAASSPPPPPLDPSLPTLLLLECVLVYLEPAVTSRLLSWFCETFGGAKGAGGGGSAVVGYDPFRLEDQFGVVMRRNLALRSLSLPGADSTPSLSSLTDRLATAGVNGSKGALSVKQIREGVIPVEEIDRVAKIEQIDEVEELNLVLDHYAVSWGNVSPCGPGEEEEVQQLGGGIRRRRQIGLRSRG